MAEKSSTTNNHKK